MEQAARSGVQNIAEGSVASGTSKKIELKLTNIARASLEELRLDYEDYLRQRGLEPWPKEHPALQRFRQKRCASLDEIRTWVKEEIEMEKVLKRNSMNKKGPTRTNIDSDDGTASQSSVPKSMCQSVFQSVPLFQDKPRTAPPSAVYAANAALSLLNLCCYFLDRQVSSQAKAFEDEGGFTERLYLIRQLKRKIP